MNSTYEILPSMFSSNTEKIWKKSSSRKGKLNLRIADLKSVTDTKPSPNKSSFLKALLSPFQSEIICRKYKIDKNGLKSYFSLLTDTQFFKQTLLPSSFAYQPELTTECLVPQGLSTLLNLYWINHNHTNVMWPSRKPAEECMLLPFKWKLWSCSFPKGQIEMHTFDS